MVKAKKKHTLSAFGSPVANIIMWLSDAIATCCALLMTDWIQAAHHGSLGQKAFISILLTGALCYLLPSGVFLRTKRREQVVGHAVQTAALLVLLFMIVHAMRWAGVLYLKEFSVLMACLMVILIFVRLLTNTVAIRHATSNHNQLKALLICNTDEAEALTTMLKAHTYGLGFAGICKTAEAAAFLEDHNELDIVYCVASYPSAEDARQLYLLCQEKGVAISMIPSYLAMQNHQMEIEQRGNVIILNEIPARYGTTTSRIVKRTTDIVLSLILLVTVFPIVTFVLMLITKKKKLGSILTTWQICGMNGKKVNAFVFRTHTHFKMLPMLLNVLGGSVSLVGSTIIPFANYETYKAAMSQIKQEGCKAKPGMAPARKLHGSAMASETEQRAEADVWYVQNWSFWLDLRIMFTATCKWMQRKNKININYI